MPASARYHLLGPLNSGTGSRALLGMRIDGPTLTPVVLLPVPRKTLDDPEALLRLRKETDRAAGLDHPCILQVLGLVQTKRGLARATAYANGEPLRRVFTRAVRLSPAMAGRVIADAATGVHYAHLAANEEGTPLVHGDLRPETIMSSYSGVTLVTGYGALSVAPTEAGGKRVPGRRKYSAPEQILGGRTAITPQTDVYLLGLVLWEALTGSVPFQDATNPDRAIVSEALALDSPRIPEKLRPVLARATEKKGTDRYPTALALREAIESAVELASPQQYAEWLAAQFVGDPIAMAQRKLVERALEEAEGAARIPPPLPRSGADAAPKPARSLDHPREARALAAPESASTPVERTRLWPIALAAVTLAVGAAGGWVARGLQETPQERIVDDGALPQPRSDLKAEVGTPNPTPAEGLLAPLVAAPSPVPLVPSTPTQLAPPIHSAATASSEPDAAAAPKEGSSPAAGPALGGQLPTLELYSVPEVEVLLGTRSLGRTPLTATVPSGKQVLTLVNGSQGIRVTREVEVLPTGSTHVEVRVGLGSLGFHAPAGAKVYVDRKLVGVAPIERRLPIYEGTHHAMVVVGDQRWEETFQVSDGDWVSFTSRPDARPTSEGTGATLRFTKEVSADTRPEIVVP